MAIRKKNTSKPTKQPHFKGHYCKVCDEYKANEKFSGKGHTAHICKSCASKSPAQQAEDITINRLNRMIGRFISKEEIKWLRNRINDKRPEVKELAQEIYNEKFPHYKRNEIKKTLKIKNLLFRIRGEIWDSYGDEYFINIEYAADRSGKIIRKSYDKNDGFIEEQTIEIGQSAIDKLFNVAVHNYNIYFWDTDLCREISCDPDIDLLPEHLYEDFDYEDLDTGLDDNEESEYLESDDISVPDNKEPTWNIEVEYNNETVQNTKGYDIISDEVINLFTDFEDYFGDKLPDFDVDNDIESDKE